MVKKQDKTRRNLLIWTGVSAVLTIISYAWLRYDFHRQECALREMDCLPTENPILLMLTRIALTTTLVLAFALLEHRYEISKGVRISAARKVVSYIIFAVILFLVIGWFVVL